MRCRDRFLAICLFWSAVTASAHAEPARPDPLGLMSDGIVATLLTPATPEPLGLIVALYDPAGPAPRGGIYEAQLVAAGFAVLVILGSEDEAETLPRALAALQAGAHGPTTAVGILGFGGGARLALRPVPGVAARVLLYPGCDQLPPAPDAAPVLLLHGSDDAANTVAACRDAARDLASGARDVRHIVYRGAGYAWDRTHLGGPGSTLMLLAPDRKRRVPVQPWPELGALSASEVAGFFATAFSRPPA